MRFEVSFFGHPNVLSLHKSTLEVTTETNLTLQGDCIIGVGASCGCRGIPADMKEKLQDPDAVVTFTIRAGGLEFSFAAKGDAGLDLSHPHDIVIRKSRFLSDRTLAVDSDTAASSVPREMVRLLQDPQTRAVLVIDVC